MGTELEVRQPGWSPAGLDPPIVPGLCKITPSLRQTLTLQQGTLAKQGPSLAVQTPHALVLGPLNF